jgi:lysyl-tRNA synthetase class 2
LETGLPSCAGVAIGVDRLLMSEAESNSIDEVVSFSWLRC